MTQRDLFASAFEVGYEAAIPPHIQPGLSIIPRHPDGRALKDAGMAATLQAERQEWLQDALDGLRSYLAATGGAEFLAEDFREFWANLGPPPHSANVWGALFNTAARQGLIRATGRYVKAKSAKTHAHPVQLWVRT